MALFGGLFDGILGGGGGGGSAVTQQSDNKADVDVGVTVQNSIDLTSLSAVLEKLGIIQAQSTDAATQATAKSASDIITAVKTYAETQQAERKALLDKALPWAKAMAAAAVLFLLTKTYLNWKKA